MQDNPTTVYEPPILLDLDEVASGCTVCITGGNMAVPIPVDLDGNSEPIDGIGKDFSDSPDE